jgi:hypothetical protein
MSATDRKAVDLLYLAYSFLCERWGGGGGGTLICHQFPVNGKSLGGNRENITDLPLRLALTQDSTPARRRI